MGRVGVRRPGRQVRGGGEEQIRLVPGGAAAVHARRHIDPEISAADPRGGLLERQAHRGGRDTVDHPRRRSDDLANALCGCAALSARGGFDTSYGWIDGKL